MDPEYRKFVQSVIDNIKRHGFPDKKVAFGLERMYELASEKGINFNKVLATLAEIKIGHEKTPEKIVFFPIKDEPASPAAPLPFAGLPRLDPNDLKNMNVQDLAAMATRMLQNMSPEQLESLKKLYENMTDEEKADMLEQAKKLGLN